MEMFDLTPIQPTFGNQTVPNGCQTVPPTHPPTKTKIGNCKPTVPPNRGKIHNPGLVLK
jgi:hypothetical protein